MTTQDNVAKWGRNARVFLWFLIVGLVLEGVYFIVWGLGLWEIPWKDHQAANKASVSLIVQGAVSLLVGVGCAVYLLWEKRNPRKRVQSY